MGLADRQYMREPTSDWRFSATVTLIILLVIAFLLQQTISPSFQAKYLELSLGGIKRGFVWQLLTFQFLHGGIMHLLLNGVTLFSFGRVVEATLDKRRFLTLYFLSGIVGGLFQILLALILPRYFGGSVVGASAGIFGVVAAFATLAPDQVITLFLFYVIPVNMRAKILLYASLAHCRVGHCLLAIQIFRPEHRARRPPRRHSHRDGADQVQRKIARTLVESLPIATAQTRID